MPTLLTIVQALKKCPARPKPEDAAAYRALLLASARLPTGNRWQAVELLRHWSVGKRFGADEGQWQRELAAWGRWFSQAFPKEPALPDLAAEQSAPSKYRYEELLAFLTKDPRGRVGEPVRGRAVFAKANCAKCHKFGADGEGVGPDLTMAVKRFTRDYILESICYPSKVISDQYRSTTIVTHSGTRIDGLAAPNGDFLTVLQQDGTKVTVRKDEIEEQFASLVSVMPERLLDNLTLREIADLFAFLEAPPPAK